MLLNILYFYQKKKKRKWKIPSMPVSLITFNAIGLEGYTEENISIHLKDKIQRLRYFKHQIPKQNKLIRAD
jgi:hypothetical protein